MKKFEVTDSIWIGNFFAKKGEILELKDTYKLYSKNGKWVNKSYVSKNIKEVTA